MKHTMLTFNRLKASLKYIMIVNNNEKYECNMINEKQIKCLKYIDLLIDLSKFTIISSKHECNRIINVIYQILQSYFTCFRHIQF